MMMIISWRTWPYNPHSMSARVDFNHCSGS